MKILIVHTKYLIKGGEDAVFEQEADLLSGEHTVEKLEYFNGGGVKGIILFFLSIWNVFAATRLKKAIREFKPDVIHIHNMHFASGPIIIRTAAKFKIPVIITLHNYRLICPSGTLLHDNKIYTKSVNASFPWDAAFKGLYRNSVPQTFWLAFTYWFHRKIGTWNMVSKYVVLTQFAKDIFSSSTLNIKKEKFVVKQNFSVALPYKQVPKEAFFLFIGRLSEEKGLHLLFEAFKNSNQTLHIAGDGPLKSEVELFVKNNSNVKYLGKLNKDEVLNEMNRCTCLLFPSIWYEGMPMTIIEAFSVGVPVIAANIGAMSSMIIDGKNGFLYDELNSAGLAFAIEEWNSATDTEKQNMYINAYESYKDQYTSDTNRILLAKIYHEANS